jgi:hypothetical protein
VLSLHSPTRLCHCLNNTSQASPFATAKSLISRPYYVAHIQRQTPQSACAKETQQPSDTGEMTHSDPIYEQYNASYDRHRSDSFSKSQLVVLSLFLCSFLLPTVLNVSPQEATTWVLNFACRMASRVGSRLLGHPLFGLQGSGGDGSALKSVFGVDTGLLKKLDSRGLGTFLTGRKSNKPPGLGNMNNSCYQNSVVQVCTTRSDICEERSLFHCRVWPPSARFPPS